MTNPIRATIAALSLAATVLALPAAADPAPGIARLSEPSDTVRPLALSVWYPSTAEASTTVGGNAVFLGVPASVEPPEEDVALPLVVLSHGGLRSAPDSGAWLAAALAAAGFLVVEVNGPSPVTAGDAVEEIWRRPEDISRALDLILADPAWGSRIDRTTISVVGHALGGTAALAIVGARLDPELYRTSCEEPGAQGPDCAWFTANGAEPGDANPIELTRSRHDLRVDRIVVIDPEYPSMMRRPKRLPEAPALFLSLGAVAAGAWDGSQSLTLRGAAAYDAFALCTPAGAEILGEEGEDPAVCATPAAQRRTIHHRAANAVVDFLAGTGDETDPDAQ